MTHSLEVSDLAVAYGRVTAVHAVSFVARPGKPVAILGRNGAGKSSLLGAIAGVTRPAAGRILLDGVDISRRPPDQRARRGVVLVPEGRRVFPNLTVSENLRLGGFLVDGEELEARLDRVTELFPMLGERIAAPARHLSGGQQQMLAVGRALMAAPAVLLLDEPSLGLAPRTVAEVYARLEALRDEGLLIVLVEQQIRRALRFADEALVLDLGRVVAHEAAAHLVDDPRLMAAYLGRQQA
jgi:branched-chain amino acid transport system ATP-binding protein